MNKAMAFKMNITPNDTAISFSFALTTGPTAAIALPPQIAVPEEIRYDVLRFILSQCTIKTPIIITPKTAIIAKKYFLPFLCQERQEIFSFISAKKLDHKVVVSIIIPPHLNYIVT